MESDYAVSLSDLPPTLRQRRWTFAAILFLLAVYGATVPFANVEVPQLSGLLEILLTMIFVADLITATLLFAQYSITRSSALLILANGYFFSSLIMIPYLMTFPGVFSSKAVLGLGFQGSPFLYVLWRFGFLFALIWYALFKGKPPNSARSYFGASILATVGLVCALAWVIATYSDTFPRFLLDNLKLTGFGHYTAGFDLSVGIFALLILWLRRSSVLDQWLIVVVFAIVLELSLVTFFIVNRSSLGAMAVRFYLAVAATAVLIALLFENTKLYAAVGRSNLMLQRERNSKLMNLEAMAASISHEVRQPLAAVVSNGSAALRFLDHAPPNLEEVRSALTRVLRDSHRVDQVFDSLRALFGKPDQGKELINANEIALEALRIFRDELRNHRIITRTYLTSELLPIMGNKGQLLEVIINLIHNAIQAMDGVKADRRVLQVKTQLDGDAILLIVEDSGPGIDPTKINSIFDPFVTTKRDGMGLGLAICRTIVERHEGKMFVVPAHPHGCVFHVVLPIGTPGLRKAENEFERSPSE
jgi:signal transduction histidine kinase